MLHVKIFPVTQSCFEYFSTNRIKIYLLKKQKKSAKKANFPLGNAVFALKIGLILAIVHLIFIIFVPYCRKYHSVMITKYIN